MVGQVTGGKNTGDGRARAARLNFHVAAAVQLKLVFDQLGRRGVADGDEHTLAGDLCDLTCFGVLHLHAFNAQRVVRANHLINLVEPQRLDLGVLHQAILQDFL